jgi:hypothetical protein
MNLIPFSRETTSLPENSSLPLLPPALRLSGTPSADTPEWALQSAGILEEASQATGQISRRPWMVVHPGNASLLAIADGSTHAASSHVERPKGIRWFSRAQGQVYWLLEYLTLRRQTR